MAFKHKPIYDELAELDDKIMYLLAKRARLMTIARKKARAQKRGVSDVDRRLWPIWEESKLGRQDSRLLRRVFDLVQEFPAPEERPRQDDSDPGFLLTQVGKGPAAINIPGPPSILATRIWAVLASQADQSSLRIDGVFFGDLIIECIKGLNQAGAKLYWEDNSLLSREGATAQFEENVIFAGDDFQNFCFLLALALKHPGRVKFTGGSSLKLADISDLARPLHWLGARLTSIARGSSGLPARVEASGALPTSFEVPDDLPREMIVALIAAAPGYEHGLELTWTRDDLDGVLEPAVDALTQCGVEASLAPGRCTVSPGAISIPKTPDLPLDPFLGGLFLSIPAIVGGTCKLSGRWPSFPGLWTATRGLLEDAGLTFTVTDDGVGTTADGRPAPALDLRGEPLLAPLAMAIAAAICARKEEAGITGAHLDHEDRAAIRAVCERLGLSCRFVPEDEPYAVDLRPGEDPSDTTPWTSPDAHWAMGFALASLVRPRLVLANPGDVTGLMPHFWSVYNALLRSPQHLSAALAPKRKPEGEPDDTERPKRRRIRL